MSVKRSEFLALRLTGDELARVRQIAKANDCTLSQAVRLCLKATTFRTVAVLEVEPPTNCNAGGVRQDSPTGIAL